MNSSRDPISLYVHIPFCALKCSYCDFNSYAGIDDLMRPFVDALIAEFRLWAPIVKGSHVPTMFLGGGTPSLLPLPEVERIMSALKGSFAIDPNAEVSFEANPGTVDLDYLRGLVTMGVNRLSFGVQSFHDDELTTLDRIHSAEEARQGYRWAREAGFERINLDLVYGLPKQLLDRWQATLEEAIGLAPEHLSLYALTVEDGTKLAYDTDRGHVAEPDPDAQADMYEGAMERLPDADFRQYEISNWSRPGEECRHNLVYWHNGEWLGLGPGAHSHWGGFRFSDVYSPKQYIDRLAGDSAGKIDPHTTAAKVLDGMPQVAVKDAQSPETAMADTAILALRLNEGLDLAAFASRFGHEFEDTYEAPLRELAEHNLLERSNGRMRLTQRGRLLANEVFVRLLPD
jgi:oxygen-independent coproporphyrinogen-3 oxidase